MTLAQSLGPLAVRSHASGIGVIVGSSLYKNQLWLYALVRLNWISVADSAFTEVTLSGMPPGT